MGTVARGLRGRRVHGSASLWSHACRVVPEVFFDCDFEVFAPAPCGSKLGEMHLNAALYRLSFSLVTPSGSVGFRVSFDKLPPRRIFNGTNGGRHGLVCRFRLSFDRLRTNGVFTLTPTPVSSTGQALSRRGRGGAVDCFSSTGLSIFGSLDLQVCPLDRSPRGCPAWGFGQWYALVPAERSVQQLPGC